MDPARIVDTATWGTRTPLGRPSLTEGGTADLVVLADDPRQDVIALARPLHVFAGGRHVG